MEINIDIDKLRGYIVDHYGTAAFSGFPVAILDVWDIERMDDQELCRHAEQLGIDLRKFQV